MERLYKDSGIEWIGRIPKDWNITKLFNLCTIKGRIGWNGLRSDEFKEMSYAYLVTGQDFTSSEIRWTKCYQIDKERYDEDPFIQLSNGDILITKDGTIGKIAKVSNMDKPACLNSGIFVLKQRKNTFVQNYLYWYLVSPILLAYNSFVNSGGTTIMHLYQNVFERFPLLIPPYFEQQRIAEYLDRKCGEIDGLITLQKQMIAQLTDYKECVITESVTKGLNSNTQGYNTGISWYGNIPKEWEIRKMKTCVHSIFDADHYMPESVDSGIPYIMTKDLKNKTSNIDFEACKQISYDDYQKLSQKQMVKKGDIIFARYATIGTVCLIDIEKEMIVSYSCVIIRPKSKILNSQFVLYYLKSYAFEEEVKNYTNTNIQGNVGIDSLYRSRIIIPPFDEQCAIVEHLDAKCGEIDKLIETKRLKIETLKEYKKSVIYEAVTGKNLV